MFKSVVHDFLEVVSSGGALGGASVIVLSSAAPLLAGGRAAAGGARLRGDRLEGGGLTGNARVRDRGRQHIGAGSGGGDDWHMGGL